MTFPDNPHQKLLTALISDPNRTVACLEAFLTDEIKELIDFEQPSERLDESFLAEKVAETQCVALFRVQLKSGEDARVFVLLELGNKPDPAMALTMMGHKLSILEQEMERTPTLQKFPVVIPIVLYFGSEEWTAPLSLDEMIAGPFSFEEMMGAVSFVSLEEAMGKAKGLSPPKK